MKTAAINPQMILEARIRSGMTQEEVAYGMRQRGHKASGQSIRRWERGRNAPHSNVIADLAAVLGVTIDHLYEPNGDRQEETV